MASNLPGFEYDIFISYRHNDNKSGWVTEFVSALQEELGATIKESLSIYFDKNPHNGLLETHNVDKSLEGKLKCLIFIPIISQTYCDPKSFAWQHEFVSFNNLAKKDQFGRDIKLGNGNVASRILPIKIHEVDAEDKAIIEAETGGMLRAIEFIYKEAGVNRPLKASDSKNDNQNKTDYRNQINKVANAIKEIITAVKNPQQPETKSSTYRQPVSSSGFKKKSALVVAFVLVVLSYFGFQKYSDILSGTGGIGSPIDKSIAVLPFSDLSKEQDLEYLGDGLAEEIINVLAQTKDLKVIARSSSFQFKGKNEDLREIGRKLGVSCILEGSVRKFKDHVRVTAQLIKVSDGSHYWSKNMDQKTENLFEIQDAIAADVAVFLKATLFQGATSKENEVWNEEAKKLYQKGRFFYDRSGEGDMDVATTLLQKSVNIDSSHALSLIFLSLSYGNIGDLKKRDQYLSSAKLKDSTLCEVYAGACGTSYSKLDFKKADIELRRALQTGASSPLVLRTAAYFCWLSGKPKQGVQFARQAVDIDPLIGRSHMGLIQALWVDEGYADLLKSTRKAVELFPQTQVFRAWHAMALAYNNEADSALNEIKHVDDVMSRKNFFINFYYKQKDFTRLDSLFNSFTTENKDAVSKAEHLIILNKKEEAIKFITNVEMDANTLSILRWSPILKVLSGDKRYEAFIKKFEFD